MNRQHWISEDVIDAGARQTWPDRPEDDRGGCGPPGDETADEDIIARADATAGGKVPELRGGKGGDVENVRAAADGRIRDFADERRGASDEINRVESRYVACRPATSATRRRGQSHRRYQTRRFRPCRSPAGRWFSGSRCSADLE